MNELMERIAEKNSAYYSELAVKAQSSQDAFSELYDYFFPRVYNFIFSRTKNADIADDIISVTFEKVFLKLGDYRKEQGAFSTWLFRIANNNMVDYYRRQQSRKETEWADFFDPAADEMTTPENLMLRSELNRELLLALDQLAERERRIVELKYMSNLSNNEIASIIGISAGNTGVILHRSLDKLRKMIENNYIFK